MSDTVLDTHAGAAAPRSRRLLWGGLVATLVASVWALMDDGEDSERSPITRTHTSAVRADTPRRTASALAPITTTELRLPQRSVQLVARPDLFATAALAPLAAAPAMRAASAAPPAPPPPVTLPYTFGGRLVTEQGPSVLLHEGAQTHVLAMGGSLGVFRLESDAGGRIEFVHVPTGERVVLTLPP